MKKRNVAEEAASLLAGLGDTPDEIAAMLRGAGYKGQRINALECPCGACLKDHLGVCIYVRSRPSCVGLDPVWTTSEPELAPQIAEFVRNFDLGLYPDLVAK